MTDVTLSPSLSLQKQDGRQNKRLKCLPACVSQRNSFQMQMYSLRGVNDDLVVHLIQKADYHVSRSSHKCCAHHVNRVIVACDSRHALDPDDK